MRKISPDFFGSVENDKRRRALAPFQSFDSQATRTFFKRILDVKRERELIFVPKTLKVH